MAVLQQLLLRQQPPIELINARQALLDCGDHLLLEQRDLLLSIGLLDPGARRGSPRRRRRISCTERNADSSSRNGSSSGRQNGEAAAESVAMESAPRAA